MTNTPPPFGPPPQPKQPGPSGESTAGHSLAGLALGFFLAILPAGVFGTMLAILSNVGLSPVIEIVVPLVLAVVIPAAIFLLANSKLKDGTAQQQQMRTAMRIIVFIAIGTYALGIILVGACIALLAGAY